MILVTCFKCRHIHDGQATILHLRKGAKVGRLLAVAAALAFYGAMEDGARESGRHHNTHLLLDGGYA